MSDAAGILGFVAVAGAIVFLWVCHFRRSRNILNEWAQRHGHTLVLGERRFMFRGPYWWRSAKGQEIFRVIVRDREGRQRGGYVRVGSWFWGALSDQVDVRWDDGQHDRD